MIKVCQAGQNYAACLGVLIGWLLLFPTATIAQRAIPDDNLAYPVLIARSSGGSGSGFYLNTSTAIYLVTAKHVLFAPNATQLLAPTATLISYTRDPKGNGRNLITANLEALFKTGNLIPHPREDIAVVRIGEIREKAVPDSPTSKRVSMISGVTVTEKAGTGIVGADLETVKKFDEVLIANSIIVFGYPTSLGLKEIPQLDPLRPLLRGGIVAGTHPEKKLLIIDCPVYPGNSGGPVVEVTNEWPEIRFKLIGVVSQFVPFDSARLKELPPEYNRSLTNSGYGIVTPMDHVLELLK